MIKNIKRFISSFLCISLLLNSCTFTSFADCDDDCTQKNSNGQFLSVCCAKESAVNKIKGGEHYIRIDNVGYNSDFTVYAFDYNSIENITSELPYTGMREIDNIYERNRSLKNTRKKVILDWAKFSGKLIVSAGLLLLAIVNKGRAGNYVTSTRKFKQIGNYLKQKLNITVNEKMKKIVDHIVIASAATFPSLAFTSIPGSLPKVGLVDYEGIFNINDNTFSAFKQISSFIKYNFWENNDVLIIVTNSNKESLSSVASFNNYGVTYTNEEKQGFQDKFNSLREVLQTKENEYEKELVEDYDEM